MPGLALRLAVFLLIACAAFGLLLALGVPAARAAALSSAEIQRIEDEGVREIVVAREPHLSAPERGALRHGAGVSHIENVRLPDTEVVRAPVGELVEAIRKLNADPDVRYAEPNAHIEMQTTDRYWEWMWSLENTGQTPVLDDTTEIWAAPDGFPGTPDADIDAPQAWLESTGAGVTVAVIDSGVDFSAPDLQGQIAGNPGETGVDSHGRDKATNGVDDEGDGLVDDAAGWDFMNHDNLPADDAGHGTHVSGTIVARRDNGIGIAGVAPDAKVFPIKVSNPYGTTNVELAQGMELAGDLGFPVANVDFGAGKYQAIEDAIVRHPDTVYAVSAGNDHLDRDAAPLYPCAFPQANVICVGASDGKDMPGSFSGYGARSVDLFAPGTSILSTWLDIPGTCGPCYRFLSGTSMAAPHVAGTLALMRAARPDAGPHQLRAALLSSVDPRASLAGLSLSGGRLNAAEAIAGLSGTDWDRDDWLDARDNCVYVANPSQADDNRDGVGDACDPDRDGRPDPGDNCPDLANPDQADADHDGVGDACDGSPRGADADGDGVGAVDDNCPSVANSDQADSDRDGVGDACETAPEGGGSPPGGDVPETGGTEPVGDTVPSGGSTSPGPSPGTGPSGPKPAPATVSLSRARLSRHALRGRQTARLTYSLTRAATVTLTISRRGAHGYRRVVKLTLRAAAGVNRYVLRSRIGRHRLGIGRYRLQLRAAAGSQAQRATTLTFTVR